MKAPIPPKTLYKYRNIDRFTVSNIVSDNIYFSTPNNFNDPLDSRPTLDPDASAEEMKDILRFFIQKRRSAEMRAAIKKIGTKEIRLDEHHLKLISLQIDEVIARAEYNSNDPEYDDPRRRLSYLLGREIETELLLQFDKGIYCLAEDATCPLMWSHYADQHFGICIGYEVPLEEANNLHQVKYGANRIVKASKIAAMISGDKHAQMEVDEAVFMRKAENWRYEKEWRLIGQRGLHGSHLEMTEIIFGLRCDDSIQFTIMKSLEERDKSIEFYQIMENKHNYVLRKKKIKESDEIFHHFPRRYRSVFEDFKDES